MQLLYEDSHLLVCVKPVGILSQRDASGKPNLEDLLQQHLSASGSCAAVYPVHRLDQAVGGVMVYAKTKHCAARLSQAIQSGGVLKQYLAIIHGVLEPASGFYRDYLFKDAAKNKSYVVKTLRKGVKEASLEYETLQTGTCCFGPVSLVRIQLHTGRTHQIRVQFASRKRPLVGDGKYGSSQSNCGIALWSYQLRFAHPVRGTLLVFTQEPPQQLPWTLMDSAPLEKGAP